MPAAMKVSGDGHLEGARLLSPFSMQICVLLRQFLGTLAEMGHIPWEGNRLVLLVLFGTFLILLTHFFGAFLILFWYFYGIFWYFFWYFLILFLYFLVSFGIFWYFIVLYFSNNVNSVRKKLHIFGQIYSRILNIMKI